MVPVFVMCLYSRGCLQTCDLLQENGTFPDCKLDLSAESTKGVVHTRENHLTLARSFPKLQSFQYHTCA